MSNNPLAVILALLFIIGALFYFVGAVIARRADARMLLEARLDMVERLMLVGQPWCVQDLEKMRDDEAEDASVREAAEAALMVIASR